MGRIACVRPSFYVSGLRYGIKKTVIRPVSACDCFLGESFTSFAYNFLQNMDQIVNGVNLYVSLQDLIF